MVEVSIRYQARNGIELCDAASLLYLTSSSIPSGFYCPMAVSKTAGIPSLASSLLLLASHASGQSGSDILPFVDPLIGTANGGHVFAGATLPFGMAKASPDSVNDGQGGFSTTGGGPITGFSHMHDSGTGGVSTPIMGAERAE